MLVFVLAITCALAASDLGNAEPGCSTPRPSAVDPHEFLSRSLIVTADDPEHRPGRHPQAGDERVEFLIEESSEEEDSGDADERVDSTGELPWFLWPGPGCLERPAAPVPALKLLSRLRC